MSASIKKTFVQYLKKKAHRITNERFLILDAATNISGHFDADELYLKMKNEYINVSRATVYKTLELMSECGILTKHNFKGLIIFNKIKHSLTIFNFGRRNIA